MMKGTIITVLSMLAILSMAGMALAQQDIIRVNLILYANGTVQQGDALFTLRGYPSKLEGQGEYKILLEDDRGQVVYTNSFSTSFFGGEPMLPIDRVDKYFKFPYSQNTSNLIVYVNGSRALTVPLEVLCNSDGACTEPENTVSCPDDCPADKKDNTCMGIISDGICDPDCPTNKDPDCMVKDCGNGRCDRWENSISCPDDCQVEVSDGYCAGVKDGICDPDCNMRADWDCLNKRCPGGVCVPVISNETGSIEPDTKGAPVKLWMVALAILIIVIAFVYYLDHRKRE